jgi:hypothetical protein
MSPTFHGVAAALLASASNINSGHKAADWDIAPGPPVTTQFLSFSAASRCLQPRLVTPKAQAVSTRADKPVGAELAGIFTAHTYFIQAL